MLPGKVLARSSVTTGGFSAPNETLETARANARHHPTPLYIGHRSSLSIVALFRSDTPLRWYGPAALHKSGRSQCSAAVPAHREASAAGDCSVSR